MFSTYFRMFLILTVVNFIACIEVIPERAYITYFNEKYISYAVANVRRAGRGQPYRVNFEFRNKHTWANNITCHFYFYEYLHNEYRRSFIELHYKLCDFFNKEPYVGQALVTQFGLKCPMAPGTYKMMNMTYHTENFPNVMPFEKARTLTELQHSENGEWILKGHVDALLKNELKKRPKKRKL